MKLTIFRNPELLPEQLRLLEEKLQSLFPLASVSQKGNSVHMTFGEDEIDSETTERIFCLLDKALR